MREDGLTLIEMMIVIAIVAVIAAFAIPTYQNYLVKAQASEALELSAALKASVVEWVSTTGACPVSGADGFVGSGEITGKYVAQISAGGNWSGDGGCIVTSLFRASDISPQLAAKTIRMNLVHVDRTFHWVCVSDIDARYLPRSCVSE